MLRTLKFNSRGIQVPVASLALFHRPLCTIVAPVTVAPIRNESARYCEITKEHVIFEDNHLIVLSKPPTVLAQADNTKDENLLDWTKEFIRTKYNKAGDAYLGLVHRIDRPCSGVMIFAKTSKAASRLSKSFSERTVDKKYVCVVHGELKKRGKCHHFLKIGGSDSNKVTVRAPSSQKDYGAISGEKLVEAKLRYSPLWSFLASPANPQSVCTVLEIDLETGRKHQIRAQLSHIGHPICGDLKYNAPVWAAGAASTGPAGEKSADTAAVDGRVKRGRGGKGRARTLPGTEQGVPGAYYSGKGIALHAFSLTVPHPVTKQNITFTAPAPVAWESHFGKKVVQRINDDIMTAKIDPEDDK